MANRAAEQAEKFVGKCFRVMHDEYRFVRIDEVLRGCCDERGHPIIRFGCTLVRNDVDEPKHRHMPSFDRRVKVWRDEVETRFWDPEKADEVDPEGFQKLLMQAASRLANYGEWAGGED